MVLQLLLIAATGTAYKMTFPLVEMVVVLV